MCAPGIVFAAHQEGGASPPPHTPPPPSRGFTRRVDLSHPLTPDFPTWPGEEDHALKATVLAHHRESGYYARALAHAEHLGTHLDAPAHFGGKATAEAIPAAWLVLPLAVVRFKPQDPDARLGVDDLLEWERKHGRLPRGALVALDSGWSHRAKDPAAYRNMDAKGVMHFPGFSAEAARFLVMERGTLALGTDTLSLDFGASEDFPVHRIVLPAGRFGLENLAHLDRVPEAGAYAFVGAPPVAGASGVPARVIALF